MFTHSQLREQAKLIQKFGAKRNGAMCRWETTFGLGTLLDPKNQEFDNRVTPAFKTFIQIHLLEVISRAVKVNVSSLSVQNGEIDRHASHIRLMEYEGPHDVLQTKYGDGTPKHLLHLDHATAETLTILLEFEYTDENSKQRRISLQVIVKLISTGRDVKESWSLLEENQKQTYLKLTNLLENTAKRALVLHFETNYSAKIHEYRLKVGSMEITSHPMTTMKTNVNQSALSPSVSRCSWEFGILNQNARQSAAGADRWHPFRINSVTGRGLGGFKMLVFGGSENPLVGHGFKYVPSATLPSSSSSSSSSSTCNHKLELYKPLIAIKEIKKQFYELFEQKD